MPDQNDDLKQKTNLTTPSLIINYIQELIDQGIFDPIDPFKNVDQNARSKR